MDIVRRFNTIGHPEIYIGGDEHKYNKTPGIFSTDYAAFNRVEYNIKDNHVLIHIFGHLIFVFRGTNEFSELYPKVVEWSGKIHDCNDESEKAKLKEQAKREISCISIRIAMKYVYPEYFYDYYMKGVER